MNKTLIVLILMATAGSAAAAEINMKPGLWRTTIESESASMPFKIPPITTENCITKEDLVPPTKKPNEECTLDKPKISGDTVSWTVQCKTEGGDMKSKGEITYQGDRYRGSISTEIRGPMNITMRQKLTGQRIGDCKK